MDQWLLISKKRSGSIGHVDVGVNTLLFLERRLRHSSLMHSIISFSTVLWTTSYNTASGTSSLLRYKTPKKPSKSLLILAAEPGQAPQVVHFTQTLRKRYVSGMKGLKKSLSTPLSLFLGLGTFDYTVNYARPDKIVMFPLFVIEFKAQTTSPHSGSRYGSTFDCTVNYARPDKSFMFSFFVIEFKAQTTSPHSGSGYGSE